MSTKAIFIPTPYASHQVVSKSKKKTVTDDVMNTDSFIVEVPYPPDELTSKLKEMTVTDVEMIRQSPHAVYYGDITSHSFNIRHVRYSPMSHVPSIQGEILEGINNRTTVKVGMNIKENYELSRTMYYTTLLPIGVIVMLLSLVVMWGTEYQWHSLLLSSSIIFVAFITVALTKFSLISTKKKELKAFVSRINGYFIVT